MKHNCVKIILSAFFMVLLSIPSQSQPASWQDLSMDQTCLSNTCRKEDSLCECFFTIEHRLTMMWEDRSLLLKPRYGRVHVYNNMNQYVDDSDILTLDGVGSRLVISINRQFPGPEIKAYEGQTMILHVHNAMHTDSTSIHFHGIHQKNSAWSDGVAFITQCPILPGQYFTYTFKLSQHGTYLYHSHIGDQRSMGLYGSFVVYPKTKSVEENEHTVILQDWNHDDDPETLYQRMLFGTFDLEKKREITPSKSIDDTSFSRFVFHSGIINGRGRYYRDQYNHNSAPLTVFPVETNKEYRFRVISAATLYPFRVFVQNHRKLKVVAADGFDINPFEVESFIIQPGERFDFILLADRSSGTYLLVAETLEKSTSTYHAAEAIITYNGVTGNLFPTKATGNDCNSKNICKVLNCPFRYFPSNLYRECVPLDSLSLSDQTLSINTLGNGDIEEFFFNFAFPGEPGETPGSVNGRQFIPPVSPILSQNSPSALKPCDDALCGEDSICSCTYREVIKFGQIYQFIISNIGSGFGFSHPVHLHGHSFYLLKIGYGQYDSNSATFQSQTDELKCSGIRNYCNNPTWTNTSWFGDDVDGLNLANPILKDTVIVPSGGYVVIRFKADNPGPWFFHCHIDLHNTNGMGMVIDEAPSSYRARIPRGFPKCGNFVFDETFKGVGSSGSSGSGGSSNSGGSSWSRGSSGSGRSRGSGGSRRSSGRAGDRKGSLNYVVTVILTMVTLCWLMI